MEFYVLDSNFNRVSIIDSYESAIWTERYSVAGDFELTMSESDYKSQPLLNEGSFISEKDSIHVGIVEKQVFKDSKVVLSGSFIELFLKNRSYVLIGSLSSGVDSSYRKGSPDKLCAYILYWYLGPGLAAYPAVLGLEDSDKEAFTNLDTGYDGTDGSYIYASSPDIEISITTPKNMYDLVVDILEPNGIGWRMYPVSTGSDYDLYWRAYHGLDRSIDQTTNPQVLFSSSLDSLINTEEMHSIGTYITAAHTYAPKIDPASYGYDVADVVGYATVPGTDTNTRFNRRTIVVTYDDITPEDYHFYTSPSVNGMEQAIKVLTQRAKDLIANNNHIRALDGELVPQMQYTYGIDYSLGDIISLKGAHDTYQKARIIEYIRSKDSTGNKEYPTLMVVD